MKLTSDEIPKEPHVNEAILVTDPTATPRRVLSRRHVSGTLPRALSFLLVGITLCASATA
ncbi:MAG: hypothetical protein CMJ84_17770 [Planctomycetes bacterium]|nr:hypothetical protein [Planctomycetota bacterium]